MQYLILVLAAMTVVIYIKEKVNDTENKEQPELVIGGWKKFAAEIKTIFSGSKKAEKSVGNQEQEDADKGSSN